MIAFVFSLLSKNKKQNGQKKIKKTIQNKKMC